MAVGKLKIGDKKLKVKEATISESFCKDGHPFWTIEVETEEKKFREYPDYPWKFRFYSEDMPVDAPGLDEIVGCEVKIEEDYDEYGEENITMYFFEHQETWGHKIKFVGKKGDKLRAKWTGRCEMAWDEKYGDDVPFELQVDFTVR
jgi:hypothetical protein